jgi:predicted esterase
MNGLPSTRLGELSEADTMKVYDLIHKEYPIDPKRTFLFGYSAGGNGGYYIGAKYAENWRAIALGGANAPSTIIPFDRIKDTPFMIEYGEKDSAGVVQASKNMVQAMKDHGIEAELVELKGEDHNTGVAAGTPYVFDFFNRHGGLAK